MAIHISELPPAYQIQAIAKLAAQQRKGNSAPLAITSPQKMGNKYHNVPTERATASGSALRFDSKKEARRYDELILRQHSGEITDLRLQTDFTLQEAYTDINGQRVRAIRYKADFTYCDATGNRVVEDVKSKATKTKVYAMKKKMLKDRYGIEIIEV